MSLSRVLLLTDVVDSTQLTERLGDEAVAALWSAHDRVARDLLPPWRGREIDKTDGMLLMFDAVDDAVGYALAYHRGLAQLQPPLRARAGVHLGPVVLRENIAEDVARGAKPLEVDGLAKPTAARIMSLARGGQLLLSQEAQAALVAAPDGSAGQQAAGGWQLRSVGHWAVKGVSAPLEIFELSEGAFQLEAPADSDKVFRVVAGVDGWVPVRQVPNNLPQPVTSFVGRERERSEVESHLSAHRLVTLLGMGGLGKTRLSLRVAETVKHQYPDGVWFIDLSPIRDPQLVASETAQALGLRDEPDRPLLQHLGAHLSSRAVLLVLDNCEHLIQAVADLAHALLRAAPRLRIIASSREALRVPGELAYPVLPLPLPARESSVAVLMRSTAVRLFVERAQSHKPGFALGEREAPAVAELVARLEGIPLALELAAARVRVLSVADINLRLRDRYKLLTGGARSLQQRQQTLRALVDWSYDMLSEAEQTLLQRLGVFVGGFQIESAEAVCSDDVLDSLDVLDLLGSLVERSLVMAEAQDDGTRYRMLETIRDYAREKLDAAGGAAAALQRHCDHFFALAKQVRDGLKGAEQAAWVARGEAEMDNLRAAIALSLGGGADAFVAVKFAVALQGFWLLRGYATEGRDVVQAALALPAIQASDMAQAFALYVGAALADGQSDHGEARRMLSTCLALRRRLGNPVEIAATLSTLAHALLHSGDPEGAAQHEREAIELFAAADEQVGVAIGHLHLGECALAQGDHAGARIELEAGLQLARRLVHREVEAECELLLGAIEFEQARIDTAGDRFQRSLQICRAAGVKRVEASALRWLARTDLAQGRAEAARERFTHALQAFQLFEMREEQLSCLEDLAAAALQQGSPGMGAQLAAAVDSARARLGLQRSPLAAQRWEAQAAALRDALGTEALAAAQRVGRQWDADEAARQALLSIQAPGRAPGQVPGPAQTAA